MKNWWRKLSDPKRAWLLVVFGTLGLNIGLLVITYEQTSDGITFDFAKQEIRPKLSFSEWLADWWGPGDHYVVLYEEVTLVGLVNNMAYRAKFYLPPSNRSVRKFLVGTNTKSVQFQEAVDSCVGEIGQRYLGNSPVSIRARSLSNMNELCPLASSYGYEWADEPLEIAQCNNLPMDHIQQQNCLDKVRFAKY